MSPAQRPSADRVQASLDALGLAADPAQVDALVRYLALLSRWNRAYNLTAVRDPEAMVTRHLADCAAVLPHVQGRRVLDVGTGAGLPGIVIAVLRPESQCVLLDSNAKKTRFCLQAVGELGLSNVRVERARVEDLPAVPGFDTVVARAFATLEVLAAATGRLCAPGGRILAMKGTHPQEELEALDEGAVSARVVRLQVPGLDADRHLVIMRPGRSRNEGPCREAAG